MAVQVRAAFPNIIIPGRYGVQHPRWPFTVNRDSPQAEALVGLWTFNPPGGSTLRDLAGTVDGTLVDMDPNTDWEPDVEMGWGLDFDNNNDHILMLPHPSLDTVGQDLTVSAWVNANTSASNEDIASHGRFVVDLAWLIRKENASDQFQVFLSPDGTATSFKQYNSNVAIAGAVHHVAFTWIADVLRLYVDGVEDTGTKERDDSVTSLASVANNLIVGAFDNDGTIGTFYDGSIYHLQINHVGLTDQVIWQMGGDPRTRWDILYELGRVFYSFPAVVAVGNPWHVYVQQ